MRGSNEWKLKNFQPLQQPTLRKRRRSKTKSRPTLLPAVINRREKQKIRTNSWKNKPTRDKTHQRKWILQCKHSFAGGSQYSFCSAWANKAASFSRVSVKMPTNIKINRKKLISFTRVGSISAEELFKWYIGGKDKANPRKLFKWNEILPREVRKATVIVQQPVKIFPLNLVWERWSSQD